MIKKAFLAFVMSLMGAPVLCQTIREKKQSIELGEHEMSQSFQQQLQEVNAQLDERRQVLTALYEQAQLLYQSKASSASYEALVKQIRLLKAEIQEIQQMWRLETASMMQNEHYALMHQPDTTLHQLVIDYGACDYAYLIPPEISGIAMSVNSTIPIPRESWGECLELILAQYGLGIRQLNPYLREIYIQRNDPSGVKAIIDQDEQLSLYDPSERLCYILAPQNIDPRSDLNFLQRFSNPVTTRLEIIAGKIFITATAGTIQELLKLYFFANTGGKRQDFQLVTLSKMGAKEMETILNSAFHDSALPTNNAEGSTLRAIPLENLPQSLFLCGSYEEVKKAVALIRDVEGQIENPQEKTVFWYSVKHSDPEELAAVLAKVYDLLLNNSSVKLNGFKMPFKKEEGRREESPVVPAIRVGPSNTRSSIKTADGQNNFIVDAKTGSIIMVVEADALPKIKELLKKLDVPKKMVQLEVLLFEKKVSNSSKSGLNLLRLGEGASNLAATGLSWGAKGAGAGILEFLVSRSKGSGIPAYDLAYQFMLGQEDVQINASPSVTTMNQTPATIAIVEEVSIDSGETENKNRIYTRAQYGITIQITPTINMSDDGSVDEGGFVTLETDITFDTPKKNLNERPDVTRRHIKNHVRIADGQTVILGGLRRKSSQDNKEGIPFLGDIPGIGKLFSHTDMTDDSTEMFVFITPKIIADPLEDALALRKQELKKRPGDIPEFLSELVHAQEREKKKLFDNSLTLLFGKKGKSTGSEPGQGGGEYDGR